MTCEGITGGSGSYDVHSINFYKLIAQSQADINKDGKIEGEQETSIFNNKMKEFDMDKNGKLDDNDVSLFKSERTVTQEENEYFREVIAFEKRNNVLGENRMNLSEEQRDKYLKLLGASNLHKRVEGVLFDRSARETLEYLLTIGKEDKVMQYYKTLVKYHNELNGIYIPEEDTNPPVKSEDIPAAITPPENTAPLDNMYLEQQKELAGQKVKQNDGTTIEYDDVGYIFKVYNAEGKETRVIVRSPDGSVYNYANYEYDANGNITRMIFCSGDSSLESYTDYEYDENGNKTREIDRYEDGSVACYWNYEYDANGNETRKIHRNEDGSVKFYTDYEYDENGNKTREIDRHDDGSFIRYTISIYNEDNKKTKEIYYEEGYDCKVYEYDKDGNYTNQYTIE